MALQGKQCWCLGCKSQFMGKVAHQMAVLSISTNNNNGDHDDQEEEHDD